jgi:hypothetical protein
LIPDTSGVNILEPINYKIITTLTQPEGMGAGAVANIYDYIDSSRPVIFNTKHSEYFSNNIPTTMGELLENNI